MFVKALGFHNASQDYATRRMRRSGVSRGVIKKAGRRRPLCGLGYWARIFWQRSVPRHTRER